MGRARSTSGETRNAYKTLVGKPDERRPLGRQRCRWVDILKRISEKQDEVVWPGFIWLRIEALENTTMNFRVP
jgi:hypothetical protein